MKEFTQGSIIYGARCAKYPSTACYAIVITARCDIANDKTNKIFNLVAVPVNDWILSDKGYFKIMKGKIKQIKEKISRILSKYDLDLDSIISFNDSEIQTVFQEVGVEKKDKNDFIELFQMYKKYTMKQLTLEQKKIILKDQSSEVMNTIKTINSGKDSHYIIVPSCSINKTIDKSIDDLVIDFHEIDYWTLDVVEKLKKNELDFHCTRLTNNEKEKYNSIFYINDFPGYAEIIGKINSPWIEFVMQHFTSFFSRIGVDSRSDTEIKDLINKTLG